MKRMTLAAALLFALAVQANASTVHCPECSEFRQRIDDANALKDGFERDKAAAEEIYLERVMARNGVITEVIAHLGTPSHLRGDAWKIKRFMLEFEMSLLNDSIEEASVGLQAIRNNIMICDVVIAVAENYIGWCPCDG